MTKVSILMSAVLVFGSSAALAQTKSPATTAKNAPMTAEQAKEDARKMLGTVPKFMTLIPEQELPAAWVQFKSLQLSDKTAIPTKYKELIGVAVSAQIPCDYCSYFHQSAVKELNKGSNEEISEAIAVAALTREMSTVLNGLNQDKKEFSKEVDRMFRKSLRQQSGAESGQSESVSGTTRASSDTAGSSQTMPMTTDAVFKDIEKQLGFVPQFMREYSEAGLAGLWGKIKALEMSSNTAISPKHKSLISLAVAAQIPCDYCVIYDKRAAKEAGASQAEIKEAIALAANTRHWSTVLNGHMVDMNEFKQNVNQIVGHVKQSMAQTERTGATESATTESGMTESGTTESGMTESGTTESGASGSETMESETNQTNQSSEK